MRLVRITSTRSSRASASSRANRQDQGSSDTVFGWQVIGGGRVRLFNGPIRLFLEYRYQSAQDAKIDGHTVEYNSSSFSLGARWTF